MATHDGTDEGPVPEALIPLAREAIGKQPPVAFEEPVTTETLVRFHPEAWPVYRKTSLTRAIRADGPFTVQTSEGDLECTDGWVAIDARGYPYPIAADEFELIYEPAPEPATIVSRLSEAFALVDAERNQSGMPESREFALAATAIEDAIMRVNRGMAHRHGKFGTVDVERMAASMEQVKAAVEYDRQQRSTDDRERDEAEAARVH